MNFLKFNTIGIICEYNPFHFGHKYHINKARQVSGCENVVCVMSGSMVQRGECAIFDKWTRAKMAIDGGADLVVELPAIYALQSAEKFACGAVSLLQEMGIADALCFGAETADTDSLKKAAKMIYDPSTQYVDALKSQLSGGIGYPAASAFALKSVLPDLPESIFEPNSTLGITYIASLLKLNSSIVPFCVERKNDYHSDKSFDGFKSATAIREMIRLCNDYSQFAPDYSSYPVHSLKNAESYILGFFRRISPEALTGVAGYENGLENLLINSAKKACSLEEFFAMCTTKRYTLHRIKRFCMCAILGIHKEVAKPDYIRILAFNSKGAALIRDIKEKSNLIPVTKTADYRGSEAFEIDIAATDFAALCCENTKERFCGKDFTRSPYVLKK